MQDNVVDNLVKQVAQYAGISQPIVQKPQAVKQPMVAKEVVKAVKQPIKTKSGLTVDDYPLSKHQAEKIRGLTGKRPEEITIDKVVDGKIASEDIRISGEVLCMQADIAEANGKTQFAESLRRAAEMTLIPDERVLEIYNMLRPNRSTKKELLDVVEELQTKYNAKLTAEFVRDAIEVYDERNILLK